MTDCQQLINLTETYGISLSSANEHHLCRIAFILNKYSHIITGYRILSKNLGLIKKHQQEINLSANNWCQISIKDREYGSLRIQNPLLVDILKNAYIDYASIYLEKFNAMVSNLPFGYWVLSSVENKNKVQVFYKKHLVNELHYYLLQLPVPQYKKEQFLALCFALLGLSLKENQHKRKFLEQNIFDEHDIDLYKAYLRDEGRNFLRTVS